jgi:hypothetical protein
LAAPLTVRRRQGIRRQILSDVYRIYTNWDERSFKMKLKSLSILAVGLMVLSLSGQAFAYRGVSGQNVDRNNSSMYVLAADQDVNEDQGQTSDQDINNQDTNTDQGSMDQS